MNFKQLNSSIHKKVKDTHGTRYSSPELVSCYYCSGIMLVQALFVKCQVCPMCTFNFGTCFNTPPEYGPTIGMTAYSAATKRLLQALKKSTVTEIVRQTN